MIFGRNKTKPKQGISIPFGSPKTPPKTILEVHNPHLTEALNRDNLTQKGFSFLLFQSNSECC